MRATIIPVLAATAVAVACSSGGGGDGGPSGPTIPDVRGTYTGQHNFTATSGVEMIELSCDGHVAITTQSGASIAGTVRIEPCEALGQEEAVETILAGTVTQSGSTTFTVAGQDEIDELVGEEGCAVVTQDQAFSGTFSGGNLIARFTVTLQCEGQEEQLEIEWEIEGSRS